jgi:RNase P/RNase MRP subunit p30
MGKRREIRIKVQGVRRPEPDTRKLARAIVRLAVEQGTAEAQDLADALEAQEADRQASLKNARSAQRRANENDQHRKGAA